jgi:hypothetical protein
MNLDLERLAERISAVKKWLLRGRDARAPRRHREAYEAWKHRDRDLGVSLDATQRFTRDEAHER